MFDDIRRKNIEQEELKRRERLRQDEVTKTVSPMIQEILADLHKGVYKVPGNDYHYLLSASPGSNYTYWSISHDEASYNRDQMSYTPKKYDDVRVSIQFDSENRKDYLNVSVAGKGSGKCEINRSALVDILRELHLK